MNCGTKLSRNCANCSTTLPASSRFCMSCGQPVSGSTSTDEARLTRLAAATPAPLAEKMRAPPLEGQRKIVTVLFADVAGSTALAEQMDPEDWTAIMNHAFERLSPVIYRYEGTIARLMGDALLAFFGAPVAHEDDPVRAIRASLDLLAAAREYAADVRRERGIEFAVRVGLNTGLVVVGEVGSDLKYEYTAMGDAVNLAARMQTAADPSTVLVADNTHRLAGPFFEFEDRGKISVKGKAEPVQVYRVVGERKGVVQARGIEGLRSPLVGREVEFAAISACVRRLQGGQGGIVAVLGEAGLGKSRLVAELRQSLASRSPISKRANEDERLEIVNWLEGRTLSFGQTISYWPFQEILRQWAGILEDDAEVEAWQKLEHKTSEVFETSEISEVLPYLASLLTLDVKGELAERVRYLDGEAMRRQIFFTSRRFFERLAQMRPTVLVFDDLHWADESSALLLEHLLPLVAQVPLLIVGLSRPDAATPGMRLFEIAARDDAERYTEIRLAPLSHSDSAQLVRNLLEIEGLPPRVREMIVRKAEGNPFFLEEVIRTLIDSGAIARDPATGRWQATAKIETITIPDTIQGVIIARVDRLAEDVQQVLRIASVIGRSFLYRVLRAIAQADRVLDQHLAELQRVELIRQKQAAPELEYIFKHALAQETTYESILLQKRREVHGRVAQAIETLFADRLEEFYGLLAHHYVRAEVWDRAQAYLLKAGDQAGRMAADAEALANYQQAMAAYLRAFGDKWDPLQRAALERKIGEAFHRRGDYTQALEHLDRALHYLGQSLPVSRGDVRREIALELARLIGSHLFAPLCSHAASEAERSAFDEEVRVYDPMLWIEIFLSRLERVLLIGLRVLNRSERFSHPLGVTWSASLLGTVADFVPLFGLAGRFHRRAVAAAEQLGQLDALGLAYQNLGVHEYMAGRPDVAEAHARHSAAAYREVGDLHGWGAATLFVTYPLDYKGSFVEALKYAQDISRFGQAGGDAEVCCWGEYAHGRIQRRMGQLDEAESHLRQAIELADSIPDHLVRVEARGELGRCDVRQGRLPEAFALFETCQRIASEHGVRSGLVTPMRNGLAEACLIAAEQSENSERPNWTKKAKRACRAAVKQGDAFRPGKPEALRLQGTYDWLTRDWASAQKWWQRSLSMAEAMGHRYDLGMVYLEMGWRLGARAHLEKAEAIFAEIGAELDLAKARELLGR